jgi:glucose-1-phosphate thymidylyltransferase
LYLYDATVFDKIRQLKPSARGELEVTDLNRLYLEDDQLGYAMLDGNWIDAGTFDSLAEASELAQQAAETVQLAVAA